LSDVAPDFNQIWRSSTDFHKSLNINSRGNPFAVSRADTDGMTNVNLISAFNDYANVPTNKTRFSKTEFVTDCQERRKVVKIENDIFEESRANRIIYLLLSPIICNVYDD
jgi:hypothetical protein